MASVTNIKAISNSLLFPANIKLGQDTQQVFSIAASGSWNGGLWVPWVGADGDMWKCIVITCPDHTNLTILVFQDFWNPAWQNAIKYINIVDPTKTPKYSDGQEIAGNNRGGGAKALNIASDGSLSML